VVESFVLWPDKVIDQVGESLHQAVQREVQREVDMSYLARLA
jgi:hypothetical protein